MTDPSGGTDPVPPEPGRLPEEHVRAVREQVGEVTLSEGNAPPDGSEDWPWYEARLSVHVRIGPPTGPFGEGGDELAHARAAVQAPSFPDAVGRLTPVLSQRWERIHANAAVVDMEPSPEVMPKPAPAWRDEVSVPVWAMALIIFALVFSTVSSLLGVFL